MHDRIGSGLRPLFEKAQLPASMHAAFNAAIKAIRDGLADADDARLQRCMVERVLAACESADSGDIAPLITAVAPLRHRSGARGSAAVLRRDCRTAPTCLLRRGLIQGSDPSS